MKFYCATLDKDCTPHYYHDLESAMNYLKDNLEGDTIESYTLCENGCDVYIFTDLGWVSECKFEDEK